MKFIKYAVGLVIALSVIPLVVVAVNNLDQPKLVTVDFEVVDIDNVEEMITFSDNTFTDLYNIPKVTDEDDIVTNLITVSVNNDTLDTTVLNFYQDDAAFDFSGSGSGSGSYGWMALKSNNIVFNDSYFSSAQIGDKWEMTFEVPSQVPPLIKTLVDFAPLLFIGGILLFMLNKRKLD